MIFEQQQGPANFWNLPNINPSPAPIVHPRSNTSTTPILSETNRTICPTPKKSDLLLILSTHMLVTTFGLLELIVDSRYAKYNFRLLTGSIFRDLRWRVTH